MAGEHVAVEDKLIDAIYATVFGEASWQDFLDRLSMNLPDGKTTLFYHDITQGKGAWDLTVGMDQATVAQYGKYYCKLNPWMPAASIRKVGVGVLAEQMYPREKLVKTEFYNDFFRKMGGESAVGVTIVREEGRSFLLSTMTSAVDPEVNRPAAEVLTKLAPHLRRAFRHFRGNTGIKTISEIGTTLFDAVNIGLAVVGEGGSVKSVSTEAMKVIDTGTCARINLLGKFRFCSEEANGILAQMLERSYDGPRSVSCVVDKVKLTFIQIVKDRMSVYFEGQTIVILMERASNGRTNGSFDIGMFAKAHALTSAETRAFAGVITGKGVGEIADEAGLSRETIRSQLKSLYAKTGTGGQIELIRMVGFPPLTTKR